MAAKSLGKPQIAPIAPPEPILAYTQVMAGGAAVERQERWIFAVGGYSGEEGHNVGLKIGAIGSIR